MTPSDCRARRERKARAGRVYAAQGVPQPWSAIRGRPGGDGCAPVAAVPCRPGRCSRSGRL